VGKGWGRFNGTGGFTGFVHDGIGMGYGGEIVKLVVVGRRCRR